MKILYFYKKKLINVTFSFAFTLLGSRPYPAWNTELLCSLMLTAYSLCTLAQIGQNIITVSITNSISTATLATQLEIY